jgi:CMP-N-acetylneuraminic acid synthetase
MDIVVSGLVAVIPARGGSKRIPRKNIIDFYGKPMIAWTIQSALETSLFERVFVSTDDTEIADTSREYGAEVPFLRDKAADDTAPVSEATIAALEQIAAHLRLQPDHVVQLMPNCPLRGATDIENAWRHYLEKRAGFQLSCFQYAMANPFWAATLDENGRPTPLFPDALKTRSQDLPTLYCPTGAIWIAETKALTAAGTFYGPEHIFCELSWQAALDIDTPEDLAIARSVAQASFGK